MKKLFLILIGVAVVSAIIYIPRLSSNASREIAQSNNVQVVPEPSNTVTKLHFENLHVSPKIQ